MRRPNLGMPLIGAACLSIALPATALSTPEVGEHDNGYSVCDEQALRLYAQGMKAGLDFGRNRIEDGKLLASGEVIPEPRPCEWRDYLDAQLHPPEPSAASSISGDVAPTAPATPAYGSTGMPPEYIAECESGNDPSAVNPSSGAASRWQIIPSTAAAYGCDISTYEGADECATRIYQDVGASAWVCG